MSVALVEHGQKARPFGSEGREIVVVAEAKVRGEFAAAYPVEGSTKEQRADAKKKAYTRALRMAREKELVISREISGVDHLWLPEDMSDIHREDGRDTH
jgi:poly(3-hydroxybutyrate) depolymerase